MTDSENYCNNCGPGGGGGNCTCKRKKCEHKWQVEKIFTDTGYEEVLVDGRKILCEYGIPKVTLVCTKCFGHKIVDFKPISDED